MADENIIAELQRKGFEGLITDLSNSAKGYNELDKGIKTTNDAFSLQDKQVENSRTTLLNLKNQIVAANIELHNMKGTTEEGGTKFKELSDKVETLTESAGKLKLGIQIAQKEITAFGTNTQGLDRFVRAVELGVNAVGILQGAQVLLGDKNKKLEETLVKLNAVMLISNGIHRISAELARDDSIAKIAAAKATQVYNFVVGESTGALRAFRIALAATGVGLFIIAIAALALNWDKVKEAINGATTRLSTYIDKIGRQVTQQETVLEQFDLEQKKLELIGVAEEKIIALRQEKLQQLIQSVRAQVALQDLVVENAIKSNAKLTALKNLNGAIGFVASFFMIDDKELDEILKRDKDLNDKLLQLQGEFVDNEIRLKQIAKEEDKKAFDEFKKRTKELGDLNEKREKDEEKRLKANFESFMKTQEEKLKAAEKLAKELNKISADAAAAELKENKRNTEERKKQDEANNKEKEKIEKDKINAFRSKMSEITDFVASQVDNINNLTSQVISARTEGEIEALDRKRKKGLITEKQYEKEVAKVKNEAAEKQHAADTAFAFARIPLIALQAYLSTIAIPVIGATLAPIAAAAAAAFGLAEAALVAAAPVPKFADGVFDLQRGNNPAGKDKIPAMLDEHESVMTAKQTLNPLTGKAIKAIHKGDFHKLFIPSDLLSNADIFANIPNTGNIINHSHVDKNDYSILASKMDKMTNTMEWMNEYIKEGNSQRMRGNERIVKGLQVSKRKYV